MASIILPGRWNTQSNTVGIDESFTIGKAGFSCVHLPRRSPFGNASPVATLLNNTTITPGLSGVGFYQNSSLAGSGVSYGVNAGMQLSSSNGIIVFEVYSADTTALYQTRYQALGNNNGFYVRYDSAGSVSLLKAGISNIITSSNSAAPGNIGVIVWSYNGSSGETKVAYNGRLTKATVTNTFIHGTCVLGSYYASGSNLETRPNKISLFAVAPFTSVPDGEMIELSKNPWQIFKPRKRISYFDAPSFPVLSSLAVSNITSSGGRLTVN